MLFNLNKVKEWASCVVAVLLVWPLGGVRADEILKVASLHPLLSDMAREVGGNSIEVFEVILPGDDPHSFSLSPGMLMKISHVELVLAMGKSLEPYLDQLRDNLPTSIEVFETGRNIPSIEISKERDLFLMGPQENEGDVDPHWWHSIKNFQRAVRDVEEKFSEHYPAGAGEFRENARLYNRRLEELYRWAKNEIAVIPRSQRKLATPHASFTYFCKEFSFKYLPIQGLTNFQDPGPGRLAQIIEVLRKQHIQVVFPEKNSNPRVIMSIVKETGMAVGSPLMADIVDAEHTTYEKMVRYNVSSIVEALEEK